MNRILLVVCSVLLIGGVLYGQETIRIGGEDTMIYIAQQCSTLYQHEHNNAPIRFDIAGGGHARAASELASGKIDILQTKIPMPAGSFTRLPVGLEYAVVYVNASNPIHDLSIPELRAIFSGQINNWRQLGGQDAAIHLFAGETTSGLEEFFQHFVLEGAEPAPFWGKSNAKDLVDAIAEDPSAIGYSSLRERPGVHVLRIRKAKGDAAVEPTADNVRHHHYPISRFVYWYLPAGARPAVRSFAAWLFSAHGQLVVEGAGYMPLLPEDRQSGLAALKRGS